MNSNLPIINRIIFKIFLITIFFLYYETILIPGAFHSWLIFIGLIFSIPVLYKKYFSSQIALPLDYILVLFLLMLILLGFFVNYSMTNWINCQAYILMLTTYVYVKENTTDDALNFIYSVIKTFVLINSILILLQLSTGTFFPARFIAAGEPDFIIATGLFDGPTKNGMVTAYALSFMLAKILFSDRPLSLVNTFIFMLGVTALLGSAQRAGLISFIIMAILGALLFVMVSIKKKRFKKLFLSCAAFLIFVILLMYYIERLGIDFQAIYDFLSAIRYPDANRYGVDVVIYKLSKFDDDSLDERFATITYGIEQIFESQLFLLSIGFGAGAFENMYGLNPHNSYFELLFTTGLYGTIIFSFLLIYVVRKALIQPHRAQVVPILFSLGSFMVFMAAHDVLRGRLFWIALGIISAFAYSNTRAGSLNKGS